MPKQFFGDLSVKSIEMDTIMKASGVAGIGFQDLRVSANTAIDKLGNFAIDDQWVGKLSNGFAKQLTAAERVAEHYLQDVKSGLETEGANRIRAFADMGKAAAAKTFSDLSNKVVSAVGLPPDLVKPFVQFAQKQAMDGLGAVATKLTSGLGFLGGPVGMAAAGLLSMGIGMLFGADEDPPPPPPWTPRVIKPYDDPGAPYTIKLGSVWEEIFKAGLRWRSLDDVERPLAWAVYAFDFSVTASAPAAGPPHTNVLYYPSGWTRRTRRAPGGWKYEPDEVAKALTLLEEGKRPPNSGMPYIPPVDSRLGWLQNPIVYGIPFGDQTRKAFRFSHDALARWVGYNQRLSDAVGALIHATFDPAASDPRLAAFTPHFGRIGWAEYIIAAVLGELGRTGNLGLVYGSGWRPTATTPSNYVSFRYPDVLQNLMIYVRDTMLAPYDAELSIKGPAAAEKLAKYAKNPTSDGLAALCKVTQLIRVAVASPQETFRQASLADEFAKRQADDMNKWQINALDRVIQRLDQPGGNGADADSKRKLYWALAAGAGAVGLLGLGLAMTRRR